MRIPSRRVVVAGLLTAGMLKIPYVRYIRTCFLIALVQSAILLVVGIFLGHAYIQLGNYLNYFSEGVVNLHVFQRLSGFNLNDTS